MREAGIGAAALAAIATLAAPSAASACGGFFCNQQPVDQTAERIVFATHADGSTTMIVQIGYFGKAEDFAWVLPLPVVPDADSLDTFPQLALNGLDAQTGPQFTPPDDCWGLWFDDADAAGPPSAGSGGEREVDVHIRAEVGPYDVAVISSEDPAELVGWLRDNDFRVTSPMEPYVRLYTEEGMKFLALKLRREADVTDIAPFKLTLPGTTPSIPLRMTALAAEPEMGILVFILGERRYAGANWPEVEPDTDALVWEGGFWSGRTNWTSLVARAVDAAGGQGWTTEMAGEVAPLRELAESSPTRDEDQAAARDALLGLFAGQRYVTRLYTRMSAEEMTSDPVFRRSEGGDVSRMRTIPSVIDGVDYCDADSAGMSPPAPSRCAFVTCGAAGLCREVERDDGTVVAGCACAPGATARTTFAPDGSSTVICQDQRLSFLNPGDVEVPGEPPLPDMCVGFDCGAGGRCVSMNMTPTCVCDRGLVATGSVDATGTRSTRCEEPREPVPSDFYAIRLPDLPVELPGGRPVNVPPPEPMGVPADFSGGGCAAAGDPRGLAGAALLVGLLGLGRRRR